jgi:putative transposase
MMPKLETKKLVIKAERKLTTKTVRSLLNAGHSEFYNILKDKCWESGVRFLECREDYTSQTCPDCGSLNKCNETYHCKQCGFQNDRDVVGALNILLKGVQ